MPSETVGTTAVQGASATSFSTVVSAIQNEGNNYIEHQWINDANIIYCSWK